MLPRIKRKLDHLDQLMESLLALMAPYTEEQINRQPGPEQWSPMQVVHHVLRAEVLSLAYVQKKLSFQPQLPGAGVSAIWRKWLLWGFLNLPFKFKAPANVATESLPAHSRLAETAAEWRKNRLELRKYLDGLPDDFFNKSIYRHPVAGLMPLDGMLFFFEAHLNRHRKQIKRGLR